MQDDVAAALKQYSQRRCETGARYASTQGTSTAVGDTETAEAKQARRATEAAAKAPRDTVEISANRAELAAFHLQSPPRDPDLEGSFEE